MRTSYDLYPKTSVNGSIVEALAKSAILDPDEDLRKVSLDRLCKLLSPSTQVRKGFVGDGQIMLELRQGDVKETIYICDVPKEYVQGNKLESHPFILV